METNGLSKRGGSEKKETHCNGSTSNGKYPQKTARESKKFQPARVLTFANFRYIVECLIASYVVILVATFLLPFIATFWLLKKLECFFVRWLDKSAVSLSGEDSLWQQGSDTNRMIISSVLLLERPKDEQKGLQNFKQVMYERLVDFRGDDGTIKFPRAKQIIRPGIFQYFFVDDPNFNMDNHVFQYDGERPKTKEELQDIVSMLSSQPLPENRSPWYYCYIPTQFDDNKDAMVFRIHHSMADGVSLNRFLTKVLPDHYTPQEETKKFTSYEKGFIFVKAAFIFARTLLVQLLRIADNSIIHGPEMTGKKKCTWSKPLDLNLVKRIKTATGTTVNDVLVACLAMAVRKYQKNRGVQSPPDFTAGIPVDISQSTSEIKFQNKFAIVFVPLPSSREGALDILYETKSRIDALKTSGEPFAMAMLMRTSLDIFPEIITKHLLTFITRKATCVLSNVPGPQYLLTISGSSIKYMIFWPPQKNNVGIGLSIFSYAGQVMVGALGDEAVLNDPETITELFVQSVLELANEVLDDNNKPET